MTRARTARLLTLIIVLGMSAAATLFADIDTSIPSATDVSANTPLNTALTITLAGASNDSGAIVFSTTTSPTHGTLAAINGTDVLYTPESGYAGSDSFQFIVTEGATSSSPATVTITVEAPAPIAVATATAHIVVRDQAGIATSSDVVFELGTTTVSETLGTGHGVAASSTLAVLAALDTASSEFDITDLQYNSGFGAFYLRCITFAGTTTPECDNWQYAVNGATPGVGMDQYVLHDGDTVYVYFGYPRVVELSATSTAAGTPVTATAKQYDPAAGAYAPVTLPYTIGATQPDPSNPWSPLEIATSTVDGSGQAIFTLNATGTYDFGIQEDYYYPTTPLSVTEAAATSSSGSGGSGTFSGGSDPYAQQTFDIQKALTYLAAQQNADGSFASPLVTDWAALALANYPGTARDKVRSYMVTHTPAFSSATDYERHAMVLSALGINPYSGTPTDTIAPILAKFDGTQVGDAALITDDIFALITLLNAGYGVSDPMLQKIGNFIISKQSGDGSFAGNPDTTAAAMLALGDFFAPGGLNPAKLGASLGAAQGYLVGQQQADGGWGNIDSTSWVQTMINGINLDDPEHARAWTSTGGKTPLQYLASQQQSDGAVASAGDRTWSTAYAIVAASGESWMSLMHYYPKPSASQTFSGGSDPYAADTDTSATSSATTTQPLVSTTPTTAATSTAATTTPSVATSTRAIATTIAPASDTAPEPAPAPAPKRVAKAPKPAPETVQQEPASALPVPQMAAAAAAQPSFFGRFVQWFFGLFGW